MKNGKKRKDLLRLETILEKDRLSIGQEYVDLIASDLQKLLADYMELKDKVTVTIKKDDKDFSVKISATAKRLKTFLSPLNE